MPRVRVLALAVLFGVVSAHAGDDTDQQEPAARSAAALTPFDGVVWQWYSEADALPRFQAYGINYGIWQATEGDDGALQAHYSFKYDIYDCRRNRREGANPISDLACSRDAYLQPIVFFSYTGEFDFYMGTRESSPVINRMNNPALHLHTLVNYKIDNMLRNSPNIRFIDLGLEHRSNGQDRDVDEKVDGRLLTEIAYSLGDDNFFDSISHSSNYVSLTAGSMNAAPDSFNYRVSAKAYVDHDSEVNWGDLADENVSILDYDIFRFNFSKRFTGTGISWLPELIFETEYTIGLEGFDTDSAEVMLVMPVSLFDDAVKLPLLLHAHFGPMNTLSNYTNSVSSIGLGVAFWY